MILSLFMLATLLHQEQLLRLEVVLFVTSIHRKLFLLLHHRRLEEDIMSSYSTLSVIQNSFNSQFDLACYNNMTSNSVFFSSKTITSHAPIILTLINILHCMSIMKELFLFSFVESFTSYFIFSSKTDSKSYINHELVAYLSLLISFHLSTSFSLFGVLCFLIQFQHLTFQIGSCFVFKNSSFNFSWWPVTSC